MGRKVFIRTIPRETATKVHEFTNLTVAGKKGKRINKTKLGNCKNTFQPLESASLGGLVTGLEGDLDISIAQYIKIYGAEPPTNLVEPTTQLVKVRKQEYFEKKHNRPPNFYSNRAFKRGSSLKSEDITFYQSFKFKFNDGTTVLDLDNQEEELIYEWCKSSKNKFVASSKADVDNYKKPFAQYYVSYEHEDEDEKVRVAEISNKAVAAFTTLNEELIAKYSKILGIYTKGMNKTKVYSALDSYIKDSGNNQEKPKLFLRWIEKNQSAEGRVEFEAEVLLIDLLDYYIVSNKQETYRWAKKDLILGHRRSDVISFIMNPHKQDEVDALKEELTAKRGY